MIRRAVLEDAEAIARLHVRSWQRAYDGIIPADYLDSLSATIDRRAAWWVEHIYQDTVVHVAAPDEVVGFVNTGVSEDGKHAELFAIYVDPDHWGEGHGKALFQRGVDHLRTLDFETGILWVLEHNKRARRFYEDRGWTESKRSAILNIGGEDVTEVRYETTL